MKDYEIYSNLKVPKNSKIILRLDGRKFHTLTRKFNLSKPYDDNFASLMTEVSKDIFNEFSPKFIYTFSDEISILLDEIPFSGRVEKINSIFSSLASSSFTFHLINEFKENMGIDITDDDLKSVVLPISFDSRIIPIPCDEIPDYFKWRQDEAWRNCINAYGIWVLKKEYSSELANQKIHGLNSSDIHELLFKKGINLNNEPTWRKRGIGIYKKSYNIKGYNPLLKKETESTRYKLFVDLELDIFNKTFFKSFI